MPQIDEFREQTRSWLEANGPQALGWEGSDAYLLVANEALQMHGGIGMTDEHDVGFFLKHARVAEHTFGDAAFHRDRFAR